MDIALQHVQTVPTTIVGEPSQTVANQHEQLEMDNMMLDTNNDDINQVDDQSNLNEYRFNMDDTSINQSLR
jgi:hypothetical protein